jgi:hypothetical protein
MPRTKLTQEDVRHYREQGWLILRGFLSDDVDGGGGGGTGSGGADESELARWKRTTVEAVDQRGPIAVGGAMHHSVPYEFQTTASEREALRTLVGGDARLTQRTNLWMTHDEMRELMLSAELGRMLAELADVDGLRIWHDSALYKEPWALPTSLHIDNPRWSFTSAGAINMWVALEDVNKQNGCMFYMSGTHLEAEPGLDVATAGSVGIGDIFQAYPQWRDREPVAVELKA